MDILIVEDNQVNATVIEKILQKNGYQTVAVSAGKEALEYLKNNFVQLIITDILMPDMSGLDLIRAIKETRELREIPIIITSSLSNTQTVIEAGKLGCRHYIVKPVKPIDLMNKVRKVLQAEIPAIRDRFSVARKIGIDYKTYDSLIETLASRIGEKIPHLKKHAATENDLKEVLNLAESSIALGAERIESVIKKIDAKGTRDAEAINSFYIPLVIEMETFYHALIPLLRKA